MPVLLDFHVIMEVEWHGLYQALNAMDKLIGVTKLCKAQIMEYFQLFFLTKILALQGNHFIWQLSVCLASTKC